MDKLKILIVEDEGLIAQDMSMKLKNMGYDPLPPVATGEKAIDVVTQEEPDIVLMDIALGGKMDGIEAAEKIGSINHTPVIYVTSYSDDNILERAKVTTPYGYIVKPTIESELRASIETACFKNRMERELDKSRRQYRDLLNASGAVPWEMDADSMKYTYMGEQAQNILKVNPSKIEDFSKWLSMVHPEDAEMVKTFYKEAPIRRNMRELEYRFVLPGGQDLWVRDSVTSSADPDGKTWVRGYLLDITRRKIAEIERERYIDELKEALDKIKTLHGLLPICAWCKKIRDDQGYWQLVEVYLKEHSEAEFTHSICPDCRTKVESDMKTDKDLKS